MVLFSCVFVCFLFLFFFFKQKTAYEMRISDWSSDVCSSDLVNGRKWKGDEIDPDAETRRQAERLARRILGWTPVVVNGQDFPYSRANAVALMLERSEERRVGKECVSTCRSRWSPEH